MRERAQLVLCDIQPQSRLLWREQAAVVIGRIGQERAPKKIARLTSPARASAQGGLSLRRLKAANKQLRQLFPDFAEIRHSVGHAQELREEATKHQVDGVVGEVFPVLHAHPLATVQTKIVIRNSLQGRTFRNTFDGQMRTYEVSSDSVAGLN